MIEYYLIGAGILGGAVAIMHQVHTDYLFDYKDRLIEECCEGFQELSKPKNVDKIVRMIKHNKENKYGSSANSLDEI